MSRTVLTTATLILATQSLFAQAEGQSSINARALINRDWAYTNTVTKKSYQSNNSANKTTVSKILSLQPTGNNSATGNVWIIKVTKYGNGRSRYSYKAWRGYYKLFEDSKDRDNLIMHLGFVRKYNGKKDSEGIMWSFDIDFEKKGVSVNVSLKNRSVPSEEISLSVYRAFFVDFEGDPIFPRNRPNGFLEELTGLGSVKKVYETEFLDLGETFKMDATSPMVLLLSSGVYKSPPNSCRLHCFFGSR